MPRTSPEQQALEERQGRDAGPMVKSALRLAGVRPEELDRILDSVQPLYEQRDAVASLAVFRRVRAALAADDPGG